MRYLLTALRIVLFILILGFAIKNSQPTELHYYLGVSWEAPLTLILLITFVIGMLAGIIACVGTIIRQKRQLMALNKELKQISKSSQPQPPAPPDFT